MWKNADIPRSGVLSTPRINPSGADPYYTPSLKPSGTELYYTRSV